MKKEREKTLILIVIFVFLILLGVLYPQLEKLENSKPSKNISINKSKSTFDFAKMFDFSGYANLSLGELCRDLEDCISFCAENKNQCETYCTENSANELCLKVNNFASSEIVQEYIEDNNIPSPEDVDLENLPDIPSP